MRRHPCTEAPIPPPPAPPRFAALSVAGLFTVASLASCVGDDFQAGSGGSDAGPCNEDPFSCPSGQVCWIVDGGFACLNQGSGQEGQPCEPTIASPTCASGLFCFKETLNNPGRCVPVCDPTDPSQACPNNEQCISASFPNSEIEGSIQLCRP